MKNIQLRKGEGTVPFENSMSNKALLEMKDVPQGYMKYRTKLGHRYLTQIVLSGVKSSWCFLSGLYLPK